VAARGTPNRNSAPAFKQPPKPQAPSQGAFGAALMEAMKKK
jgi:uncharacterized protein